MLTHRMRRGETLEMLSARYHVPVCMIMRMNGAVLPRDICAGRMIKIPPRDHCAVKTQKHTERAVQRRYDPSVPCDRYVVQKGDSLHSIAGRFGLTMRILAAANGIGGEISVGDALRIPQVRGRRYCVRQGESLQGIARRFGAREARIRAINALSPDEDVHAGMMLIIG